MPLIQTFDLDTTISAQSTGLLFSYREIQTCPT